MKMSTNIFLFDSSLDKFHIYHYRYSEPKTAFQSDCVHKYTFVFKLDYLQISNHTVNTEKQLICLYICINMCMYYMCMFMYMFMCICLLKILDT